MSIHRQTEKRSETIFGEFFDDLALHRTSATPCLLGDLRDQSERVFVWAHAQEMLVSEMAHRDVHAEL